MLIEEKQSKIINSTRIGRHNRKKGVDVDVIKIENIQNGVQVFARIYKDGKQVGFGRNGKIDIERFRFFNPPVIVGDRNNPKTLREEPEEALLQMVEDAFWSMRNKIVGSNLIEHGSTGKTTSTFYASVDGSPYRSSASTSFDDFRTASGTDVYNLTYLITGVRSNDGSNWTFIARSPILFDTSAVDDGDIISVATFSVYGKAINDSNTSAITREIALVSSNPTSTGSIVAGDYLYTRYGTTKLCDSNISIPSANLSGYNDLSLNASGISEINKTGITKLALIHENDRIGGTLSPSTGPYSTLEVWAADATGTTQDPKLVIEHSAGVTFRPHMMLI